MPPDVERCSVLVDVDIGEDGVASDEVGGGGGDWSGEAEHVDVVPGDVDDGVCGDRDSGLDSGGQPHAGRAQQGDVWEHTAGGRALRARQVGADELPEGRAAASAGRTRIG